MTHGPSPVVWLLILVLISWGATTSAARGGETCEELLDTAQGTAREADSDRRLALYREAFEACETQALSIETAARLAERRAYFARAEEQDPEGAVAILRAALAEVAERGGTGHPARIDLLVGLADSVYSRDTRGSSLTPETQQTVVELAQEAQALREGIYGPESLEAAAGHLYLAAVFQTTAPGLAEQHALRAFEISRERAGLYSREAFEALSMLAAAREEQGKDAEVAETRELIREVLAHVDLDES